MTMPAAAAAASTAQAANEKRKERKATKKAAAPKAPAKKKSNPATGSLASFLTGGGRYSEKHYRRILAAEFVFGVVILTWEELTDQRPMEMTINGVKHNPPRMKQYAAWCFAYFLLALLTTGGTRTARISSQLGGLLVLAILMKPVSNGKGGTTFAGSNVFNSITALFGSPAAKAKATGKKPKGGTTKGVFGPTLSDGSVGTSSGGDSAVQIPGITNPPFTTTGIA